MTTYRFIDSAHALPAELAESDRAAGCGVMRGVLLGGLLWAAFIGVWLAL